MAEPVTWNKDIKAIMAIGVVPDMIERGYNLGDYQYVKSDYDVLHNSMASDSMPPGVSDAHIAFIENWIDDGAPVDGFLEVQDILDRAIGGKTSIDVHGKFWSGLSRDDFVAYKVFGTVQLLEVNNGAGSNLIKALKGEAPFDGSQYNRMPSGFWWTNENRAAKVALFEQWKTDGFLKDTDTPVPAMTAFKDVVAILDAAVGGASAPVFVHGAFWRGVSRDDFVAKSVIGTPLLVVNDGASSNLIKALKGEAPFDGTSFPRMPVRHDPVSDSDIKTIQDWIDGGCPA